MSERGKYLVLEGSDGIGKTTQAKLLNDRLNQEGIKSQYLHEPGGTDMGEEIERLVKSKHIGRAAMSDLLLHTTARIESYNDIIKPTIEEGGWVVADRNWLSSVAYQGNASGLGKKFVLDITKKVLPSDYIYPDFTFLVHASEEHRQRLLGDRGTSAQDYYETKDSEFQQKVRAGYDALDSSYVNFNRKIGGRVVQTAQYLSVDGTPDEVHERIWNIVEDKIM